MELGERIRQARLEAGLSQRQLCGDKITRNMLSQIENGSAQPSMDTLRYLAGRLGKSLGFFLDDDAQQDLMNRAWASYDSGDDRAALDILEQLPESGRDKNRVYTLLKSLTLLRLAETGADQGREAYARKLLAQAQALEVSWLPELKLRRLSIQAELGMSVDFNELPDLDDRLYLYAYAAMRSGAPKRAADFLDAAEDHGSTQWHLLRARTLMAQGEYASAAKLLQLEEKKKPEEAAPLLEQCFRELGDFQQAYYYACMQRG